MGESLKGRLQQQCIWCETLGGNRVKLFLKRFLKCKWALALITSLKVFATNGDFEFAIFLFAFLCHFLLSDSLSPLPELVRLLPQHLPTWTRQLLHLGNPRQSISKSNSSQYSTSSPPLGFSSPTAPSSHPPSFQPSDLDP